MSLTSFIIAIPSKLNTNSQSSLLKVIPPRIDLSHSSPCKSPLKYSKVACLISLWFEIQVPFLRIPDPNMILVGSSCSLGMKELVFLSPFSHH
ncbi:Uncharacterized protein TCM_039385 [Theobroma cacao]|uniref:Uncharacterized protein n=1 Tax=Theobroma cacao TaxID=3641 RepID=A0A061GQ59_THECC|nr:Uncharacterized protein TCM_039385 [Theobroma cacao]